MKKREKKILRKQLELLAEKSARKMRPKAIRFICTCTKCPEQYDIHDSTGNLIGYVRVRWGRCEAWRMTAGSDDQSVYSRKVRGWWNFDNALERWIHLRRIRRAFAKCRFYEDDNEKGTNA